MAIVEAAAAISSALLVDRGWMAGVTPASAERAAAFVAHRDPVLGWSKSFAGSPPGACVSAYGDSFTAGSGVSADETYPQQLASRLGCPVANYGVGGYGDDQSLMLARAQRTLDRAPAVVIGHSAEDLLRNVSRYEGFLYPGGDGEPAFKPRFVLTADGRLATLAPPVTDEPSLRAFERYPDMAAIDAFVDRPRRTFPYTIAIARWLLTDFHVRATIRGVPRYAAFYDRTHPSGAFPLTTEILTTFAKEAERDGRRAFVLLIPTASDVTYRRKTGGWIDEPLAVALGASGVHVIRAALSDDPCRLFTDCTGHLSARGNGLVAEAVATAIGATATDSAAAGRALSSKF